MDCHETQELILESFEGVPSREAQGRIDAHVRTCADCSRFALIQHRLDDRLSTLLVPPPVFSPVARAALRRRIHGGAGQGRADLLPEIVHFGSFGIATLVMAAVLPVSTSVVAVIGVTVALASFVLLSLVRDTFDDSALGADV